jgi:uncharacterized OB-fold protein
MNDATGAKAVKPVPHPTPLSAPYWEAARQGRLVLQHCGGCGRVRHYPRILCSACHSFAVEWREVERRGAVHSWTVSHFAFHPAFADEIPYTLATVDLACGVRVLGRYRGAPAIRLGLPVAIRFENDAQGTPLLFVDPA